MTETTTTTGRTLSPWHVDYYAETISRGTAEAAEIAIAYHVEHGHFTTADADAVRNAANKQRQFWHDLAAAAYSGVKS